MNTRDDNYGFEDGEYVKDGFLAVNGRKHVHKSIESAKRSADRLMASGMTTWVVASSATRGWLVAVRQDGM